jgi:3'-5' exonuclease
MLAQIFAGGPICFVFRGDALDLLLHSHWLRRQWAVAHNLSFDIGFLMQTEYRLPAGRRWRGRYECSQQAAGLVTGVGHGGALRGLDKAAEILLGVEVPKEYQLSDWRAAALSAGQIAYAAADPVLSRRVWDRAVPELRTNELIGAYALQRDVIVPVAEMQSRGLKLDKARHDRVIDKWSHELADARRKYTELTGNPPAADR